ncbi:hypothetical protein [Amycolatopsis sp. FDAARGOS 1241]|uniref:hypothetical protein n=1 Tax=Amycolatopsis sp. FDAARGOS 1241 TaxID=2778070 RepID=UPI00194F8858|nr:hypothetical protein [Amycolatopsis sp. FDAARGOS 1241]QRP44780.1 hypothetical protein I6J71_36995 [Amycolatopsis sp. FDAARGOS 1241]
MQVLLFVVWWGRPFRLVGRQWVRFTCANTGTIGGGILTYAVLNLWVPVSVLSALAGSFVAAGLVVGMQFEDALPARWPAWLERVVSLGLALALAVVLYVALFALAGSLDWDRAAPVDWAGHVALNAIGVSVILHVAIGRRWPLARNSSWIPFFRFARCPHRTSRLRGTDLSTTLRQIPVVTPVCGR